MKKKNRIDNFLSWFDFFEGNSPLFWLIFGFMFIIIVEEVIQLSGFSRYFVEITISLAIIARVFRSIIKKTKGKKDE